MDDEQSLPFIDRHAVLVDASPEEVWDSLSAWLQNPHRAPGRGTWRLLAWALEADVATVERGAEEAHPRLAGFRVQSCDPHRSLVLAGRHRFSEYRMTFLLSQLRQRRTELSIDTHAAFVGKAGRMYRGLVIETGVHAVVVRRMLRRIRATVKEVAP